MTVARAGDIGEEEVIRRLAATLPPAPPGVTGVGDDCAVVPAPRADEVLVLKSDPVIEGHHFQSGEDPRRVGHKALGRVLSDFAAMGARPRWALVNLVAPPDTPVGALEEMYRGMVALATRHGVALVGGDVSAGERIHLHVFGAGSAPRGGVLLRSGAASGDLLFVTGRLGGSLRGRHLDFEPRLQEGEWLARQGCVTAMCDVSDGVATDVRHLAAASGLGVEIDAARIPVSPDASAAADGRTPLFHALCDGEDFELLFTARADRADALEAAWALRFDPPLSRIGRMTSVPGVALVDERGVRVPCDLSGFEHFRERPEAPP